MATKKTSYTNADLKPEGGPTTTYGRWQTKPGASMQALLGEDEDQNTVLADAKAFLRRTAPKSDPAQLKRMSSQPTREEGRLNRESTLGGQIKANPIRTVKEGVLGAALPLSFASGPVGMAAGLPLALQALGDVAESPSLGTAVMAGLAANPYVRAVRGAAGAAKTAGAGGRILQGADMFGDVGATSRRASEIPYRMPAGSPTPYQVSPTRQAIQALGDEATTPFNVVDDAPGVAQSGGIGADILAKIRASIGGLPNKRAVAPEVTKLPLGTRSRPSTREFAQEEASINSLSEQDIAELMDAISWARR